MTKIKDPGQTSVRADAEKMKRARELNISFGDVFRQALDDAILAHEVKKKCPTCGQKVTRGKQ